MADFNEYRFKGFKYEDQSNKYWKFNSQVNNDGSKILVKIAPDNYFTYTAKSGHINYVIKLDRNHVAFIKWWQMFEGWYGDYMLIDKNYWRPVESNKPNEDMVEKADLSYDHLLEIAKEQKAKTDMILISKD